MQKTRRNRGRGVATRGWKKQQPGTHQRTVMLQKCGKKCFLGPNKSFPICKKNTCKKSKKGIYVSYQEIIETIKNNPNIKKKKNDFINRFSIT